MGTKLIDSRKHVSWAVPRRGVKVLRQQVFKRVFSQHDVTTGCCSLWVMHGLLWWWWGEDWCGVGSRSDQCKESFGFNCESKGVGTCERKMHGGVGMVCVRLGMVCLQTYSLTHLVTDDNSSPINTHTEEWRGLLHHDLLDLNNLSRMTCLD